MWLSSTMVSLILPRASLTRTPTVLLSHQTCGSGNEPLIGPRQETLHGISRARVHSDQHAPCIAPHTGKNDFRCLFRCGAKQLLEVFRAPCAGHVADAGRHAAGSGDVGFD